MLITKENAVDNKSGFDVLYKGLERVTDQEEFEKRVAKTLDDNVELVFRYTEHAASTSFPVGAWVRTHDGMRGKCEATAESGVYNAAGETEGTITVVLSIETRPIDRDVVMLRFGKNEGPTVTSDQNPRLRDLAVRVFGEKAVSRVTIVQKASSSLWD